jgi:hypothetical protein
MSRRLRSIETAGHSSTAGVETNVRHEWVEGVRSTRKTEPASSHLTFAISFIDGRRIDGTKNRWPEESMAAEDLPK